MSFPTQTYHGYSSQSTFEAALPYGAVSIITAAAGATTALVSTTTAIKIAGVAAGVIGGYAFLGTLVCALIYSGDSDKFKSEVLKHMVTWAAQGIADLCITVAKEVISSMIWGGKRDR